MCYFLQETLCTQRIFTKPNYTIPFYFSRDDETKLHEDEKESLEGFITEEECLGALKKNPGTDGLPTEFYNKNFWLEISTNLVNTYTLNFAK